MRRDNAKRRGVVFSGEGSRTYVEFRIALLTRRAGMILPEENYPIRRVFITSKFRKYERGVKLHSMDNPKIHPLGSSKITIFASK